MLAEQVQQGISPSGRHSNFYHEDALVTSNALLAGDGSLPQDDLPVLIGGR